MEKFCRYISPFLPSTARPQQPPLGRAFVLILDGVGSRPFLLHFLLVLQKQWGASTRKTSWKTAYRVDCGLLKRHWKQRADVRDCVIWGRITFLMLWRILIEVHHDFGGCYCHRCRGNGRVEAGFVCLLNSWKCMASLSSLCLLLIRL